MSYRWARSTAPFVLGEAVDFVVGETLADSGAFTGCGVVAGCGVFAGGDELAAGCAVLTGCGAFNGSDNFLGREVGAGLGDLDSAGAGAAVGVATPG